MTLQKAYCSCAISIKFSLWLFCSLERARISWREPPLPLWATPWQASTDTWEALHTQAILSCHSFLKPSNLTIQHCSTSSSTITSLTNTWTRIREGRHSGDKCRMWSSPRTKATRDLQAIRHFGLAKTEWRPEGQFSKNNIMSVVPLCWVLQWSACDGWVADCLLSRV